MQTAADKKFLDLINKVREIKSLDNYVSFKEILNSCESDIQNKEYRITVVGQFSSGKSTMLNALIGKDVLTHANTETTATVTYIHNVPENDKKNNKIIVNFNQGESKELPLTSDVLKNFTSTFSNENNVAKEIYSVDIFVHFTETDYPIVLIDTPGLNGMAMGHREITLREIEKSHASICLFDVKGVGEADRETLELVKRHQNVFFFVLNAVDKLHENEGMTYEQRVEEFKKEIKTVVYKGEKDAEYVYGISALNALEARDADAYEKFNKGKKITPEIRQSCLNASHIETLESALYSFLKGSEKEKEFFESIKIKLLAILERIKQDALGEKKTRSIEAENIPEKNILLKRKEKISSQIDGYRKEIENALFAKIADIEKEIKSLNNNYWESNVNQLTSEVSSIDNLERAKECVQNNVFGKKLVDDRFRSIKDLENTIRLNLQEVYAQQLKEIKSRLPEIQFDEKGKIDVVVDYDKFDEFNQNRDLTREQELKRRKEEKENKMKSLSSYESVSSLNDKLANAERQLSSIENQKDRKINELGKRPSAKKTPQYEYVDVSSKLRKFGDWIGVCDRKYEKQFVGYEYDDTRGEIWDDNYSSIESEYDEKISSKENEISYLTKQLDNAKSNEFMANKLRQDIADLENEIREERKFQAELEKNAKTSALKKLKESLTNMVLECAEEIRKDNNVGIEDNIKESKKLLSDDLKRYYEEQTSYYLRMIDQLISQVENTGDNLANNQAIKCLEADIETIDKIEKQLEVI